jgi:hypothetical protein
MKTAAARAAMVAAMAAAMLACAWPAQAEQAASVSQFGVTWTFDKPYECGRFATGDWWVVGPVRIVAIDPACVTVDANVDGMYARKYDPNLIGTTFRWIKNGSMVNPTPSGTTRAS